MKIIAESSTTRTEWALVEGNRIVEHAFTTGINPFFQTRREISHCIRLELDEVFFRRRWEHVYFYCAGCSSQEKRKIVESSLVAQFKTYTTVESDLLGAARGLLVRESGLACILSSGSNSCLYNGQEIIKNVPPLGYILGDEGSGAYIGKLLVSDILKGIAPDHITGAFYERFMITPTTLMDEVYRNPLPSRTLSRYSTFLADYKSDPYAYNLVYQSFMRFFERNVAFYDYKSQPVSFVGNTCTIFQDILEKAAADFGVNIAKITRYSMPGLVEFHACD